MLYSTYRSVFSDPNDAKSVSPRNEAVKHGSIKLRGYITPEDSTDSGAEGHLRITEYRKIDFYGLSKAALWIAVSICLSLLIGKLG